MPSGCVTHSAHISRIPGRLLTPPRRLLFYTEAVGANGEQEIFSAAAAKDFRILCFYYFIFVVVVLSILGSFGIIITYTHIEYINLCSVDRSINNNHRSTDSTSPFLLIFAR